MNHLSNLLEGVVVEWKPLAQVCQFINGRAYKRPELLEKGKYPVLRVGNFFTNEHWYYSDLELNEDKYCVAGDLLYAWSASFGPKIWEGEKVIYHYHIWKVVPNKDLITKKYLYYLLNWDALALKREQSTGATMVHISKGAIEKRQLPIPSLEIQKEIVRVLDSFSELTTELTTELTAEHTKHKLQYSYYLEQLFSFEESEIEWKSLNEIGEFQRGKRFVRTDLISEGIPTIHYGEMYTHYGTWAAETKSFVNEELVNNKNLRMAAKGDVVIVAAGETIEDLGKGTAWLGDEGVVIHDACFSYRSHLNPKYVAYFTRTRQYHDQIRKHISSGKISAINSKGLSKVVIPVPSKEVQERIVSILDQYDILTTSISEELLKEIELRKKQYEYYRDVLLSFPNNNLKE